MTREQTILAKNGRYPIKNSEGIDEKEALSQILTKIAVSVKNGHITRII
jgi:hypothetical protein